MHYSNKKFSLKIIFSLSFILFFASIKLVAQPLVADGGLSQTICNGSSTAIGGSPTANFGTPGYTYAWAPAAGLSDSTVSNPVASPTSTTTYTITVTDAVLTVATSTVTVTVTPLPATPTPGSSSPICDGTNLNLTAPSAGGASYSWTGPNSFASTLQNPTIVAASTLAAGTYSVTVTVGGCTSLAGTTTAIVNPYPDPSYTYSSSGCQFSPNAFPTFLPGASAGTFTSAPAGMVINPTTGEIDLTATPIGSYTVTNTIPASGGCPSVGANNGFNVYPIPDIAATPSTLAICSGSLCSVSFTSSVGGATFPWTSSESNTSGSALSGTGNLFEFLSVVIASAGTTTYVVTPTANGCSGTPFSYPVTVNPTPNPNFTYPGTLGCQFSPNAFPSFLPGASAGIFTSVPAAGIVINPSTGEIDLSASTPSFYSITNSIAASGGCPTINANQGFTITTYLSPTITDVSSICSNGTAFNYSAASTGGTWAGTGIANASLGTFDPAISGLGTFSITYSTPGPCINIDTTMISVTNADLHGKVTYSGGDINSGTNTAILFYYSSTLATFDTAQVRTIDALGYFHFTSIFPGDYLIKVYADTLVYPLAVPTYYDSEYLWDTALVKTHGCVSDTANVYMVEGIALAGPGMLSGQLTEGDGFVRLPGEPIPGIDVKLGKNPGGAMITNTQTDPLGNYSFTNLPINTGGQYYTIYVDIPGLERDSTYNITVTATDYIYTQLDYKADSNSVYPTFPLATSIVSAEMENKLSVFPNPTNTNTTIEYVLSNSAFVKLEVVDVLGKSLQSLVNTSQVAGTYKVNLAKLTAGIYFIKLNINNQTNTTRLVVID